MSGSVIDEIVSDAHACADGLEFRRRVLLHLFRVVPFDSAILLPARPDVGPPAAVDKDRRFITHYLAQRARYEPDLRKGRTAARAGGGAYIDTEVYTPAERENLPFFAEIIRPQGITSQLAAHVMFRHRTTCIVHLCRHGSSTGFRPRDLDRLLFVLPGIAVSHAAFDGAVVASAAIATATASSEGGEVGAFRDLFETLSPREREVARYVARGYRNRDIALAVGASPNTVRNHLYQVFAKLGTSGRTELAVRMQRAGLAVRSY